MNTKLLMTISAVALGATGVLFTFMPKEVATFLHLTDSVTIQFEILGALYFGFAMLNWTAKANLIGGIYSRPVCMANFTHFLIGGLALLKFVLRNSFNNGILVSAILYLLFAILFGYVLFTTPSFKKK